MKKILLASVALSAFAGAAAAEVSLTWGGAATVGMAREGEVTASGQSGSSVAAGVAAVADANASVSAGGYVAHVLGQVADVVNNATDVRTGTAGALADATTEAGARDQIRVERLALVAKVAATEALTASSANLTTIKNLNAEIAKLDAMSAILDQTYGSAAVATGDFDSYSEVNLTATATVTTDYGITVTGAVSVDAGTGYDFADDDGFDAAKTNGVSLDYITIDGGSFGALTFDKNDIEHLVDADDDATADLKYTNDFGVASFALVMDIEKDTDVVASREGVAWDATNNVTTYNAGQAADVAWSAMVSAPIADMGTVYAAFDEEGGNAFGGSFMVANVTIGLDSKLEALEEELGEDRSNTISVAYSVDGLSLGAEWNSVEDGNQWAVNAAYAANGMAVAFDTNEAEEWTATASYDLSDAASVDLGVNYTEDAFVGLSLAF